MASHSSYQTNLCLSPLAEMSLVKGVSLPAEFGADNVIAALICILSLVRFITIVNSCLNHFILVRRNTITFGFAYSTTPVPRSRFSCLFSFIAGRKMGRAKV